MRKKRPNIARLDQVRISRDDEHAIIESRDSTIATTRLLIGLEAHQMADDELDQPPKIAVREPKK